MKTKLCDLIVLSPFSPRVGKIRVTRQIMILVFAFVVSFFAAVALTSIVSSQKVDISARARLREENQVLKLENKNLELQTRRLEAGVSRLEGMAERITVFMESD